jgi:hypothetical protein
MKFRTNWAGRSMRRTPRSIADYDEWFNPVRRAHQEKVVISPSVRKSRSGHTGYYRKITGCSFYPKIVLMLQRYSIITY